MTPSLSHLRNAGNPRSSSPRPNVMKRAYGLIPLAAITLAAALSSCSSAPAQMTVHGTVRVTDNEPIDPLPVNFGTQVTITTTATSLSVWVRTARPAIHEYCCRP